MGDKRLKMDFPSKKPARKQASGDAPFQLTVAPDAMSVSLDCNVSADSRENLAQAILNKLSELGVVDPPDKSEIMGFIREGADKGENVQGLEIVKGLAPVPPKEGKIEWADDFFNTGFVKDASRDRVDYHQRAAHASVHEGDLLARIIPAKEGTAGHDVLGKAIEPAKLEEPSLNAGDNVREDSKEKGVFYAAVTGRISLSGDTVSCDTVYEIRGDVGPVTGNITHPGDVHVSGDVLDGFQIEAEGDIDVRGTVEAHYIKAGGGLTAHGGITGASGQQIEVEGSVKARFIIDATVLAGGDVEVQSEIILSTVKAKGWVRIPGGRIVGGSVAGEEGIEVGHAGSAAATPTTLRAGTDSELVNALQEKDQEIERLERLLEKIQPVIESLTPQRDSLPDEMAQHLEELVAASKERNAELIVLRREVDQIYKEVGDMEQAQIVVTRAIFPEVTFCIQNGEYLAQDRRNGPVKVIYENGSLVLK